MNSAINFAGAIVLTYGGAFLVWPALRKSGFARWGSVTTALLVAAFSFLIVPAEARVLRACAFAIGGFAAIRIYSYSQAERRGGFLDYVRFLSVALLSPHLLYSPARCSSLGTVSIGREALRIAVSAPVIPLAHTVAKRLVLTEMGRSSWILNHLIVIIAGVVIFQAGGQCALGIWRMLGLRAKPLVDNVLLSRTPAEFWRRWSWPIHTWLYRHVFIPAGGRRHAARATLAVFLVSTLLHQAISLAWVGRVTGHWAMCFSIGAVGVLLSPALEALANRGTASNIAARFLTMVLLTAMATPGLIAINYVVPLYHKEIWLMW